MCGDQICLRNVIADLLPLTCFLRIQFIPPPVELSPRYSQLLGQGHDVFAASQPLHRCLTEVLRISSLCHPQFLSCNVPPILLSQFWGSLQTLGLEQLAFTVGDLNS